MKKILTTAIILGFTSLLTVGCTDTIIAAAVDAIEEELNDDSEGQTETSQDSLLLIEAQNNFTLTWDKKDSEYNEVIYKNNEDNSEEVAMVGTTAMLRSYICSLDEDEGNNVSYSCIGLGTPSQGDDSVTGEVILNFQKDTNYTFLISGEFASYTLQYSDGVLSISSL